jgi:hypothetical protein
MTLVSVVYVAAGALLLCVAFFALQQRNLRSSATV